MKFSDLVPQTISTPPLALRPDQVEMMIGGEGVLRLAKQARWLSPAVESKRMTLYDTEDVNRFWEKLKIEGYEELKKEASKYRATRQGLKSASG